MKDITKDVEIALTDQYQYMLLKCVCGQEYNNYSAILETNDAYSIETFRCKNCKRRISFSAEVTIFSVDEEEEEDKDIKQMERELGKSWQELVLDIVNVPSADALEKLWRDVVLSENPDYGTWQYPGQAYRHLSAVYKELKEARAGSEAGERCTWTLDFDEYYWDTECGTAYIFDEDLEAHEINHCPKCGRKLNPVREEEEE